MTPWVQIPSFAQIVYKSCYKTYGVESLLEVESPEWNQKHTRTLLISAKQKTELTIKKRVFFYLTCSTSTQIERFQKAPSEMFETPCIYIKSLHINSNIAQFKLTRLPTHLKRLSSRQCQIRNIRY